jgi:beta-glucosidase-like glycosyl hydrolase
MFIEEGLHGYNRKNIATILISLQLADAFNTNFVQKIGRTISFESGSKGIHMILSQLLELIWDRINEN